MSKKRCGFEFESQIKSKSIFAPGFVKSTKSNTLLEFSNNQNFQSQLKNPPQSLRYAFALYTYPARELGLFSSAVQ